MYTGNCVLPTGETDESKPKYCEVRGWCAEGNTFPHDPDAGNYDVVIDGVEDWSLYVVLLSLDIVPSHSHKRTTRTTQVRTSQCGVSSVREENEHGTGR